MTENSGFEISRETAANSLFPPHGRIMARREGQVLLVDATGPFNVEMAHAYLTALDPLLAEARAIGNYVTLVEYHESILMCAEILEVIKKSLEVNQDNQLDGVAIAYVVGSAVEGRSVIVPILESYVLNGRRFKIFFERTLAMEWLRDQLSDAE